MEEMLNTDLLIDTYLNYLCSNPGRVGQDEFKQLYLQAKYYNKYILGLEEKRAEEEILSCLNTVDKIVLKKVNELINFFVNKGGIPVENAGEIAKDVLNSSISEATFFNKNIDNEVERLMSKIDKIYSIYAVFRDEFALVKKSDEAFGNCFMRMKEFWKFADADNIKSVIETLSGGLGKYNFTKDEIADLTSRCASLFARSSKDKLEASLSVIENFKKILLSHIANSEIDEKTKVMKTKRLEKSNFKDRLKRCSSFATFSAENMNINLALFSGKSIYDLHKMGYLSKLPNEEYERYRKYKDFKLDLTDNDIEYIYFKNLSVFNIPFTKYLDVMEALNQGMAALYPEGEYKIDTDFITGKNLFDIPVIKDVGSVIKNASSIIALLSSVMNRNEIKEYLKQDLSIFTLTPKQVYENLYEAMSKSSNEEGLSNNLSNLFIKGFNSNNTLKKNGKVRVKKALSLSDYDLPVKNNKININLKVSLDQFIGILDAFETSGGVKVLSAEEQAEDEGKIISKISNSEPQKEEKAIEISEEDKLFMEMDAEYNDLLENMSHLKNECNKIAGDLNIFYGEISVFTAKELKEELFNQFKNIKDDINRINIFHTNLILDVNNFLNKYKDSYLISCFQSGLANEQDKVSLQVKDVANQFNGAVRNIKAEQRKVEAIIKIKDDSFKAAKNQKPFLGVTEQSIDDKIKYLELQISAGDEKYRVIQGKINEIMDTMEILLADNEICLDELEIALNKDYYKSKDPKDLEIVMEHVFSVIDSKDARIKSLPIIKSIREQIKDVVDKKNSEDKIDHYTVDNIIKQCIQIKKDFIRKDFEYNEASNKRKLKKYISDRDKLETEIEEMEEQLRAIKNSKQKTLEDAQQEYDAKMAEYNEIMAQLQSENIEETQKLEAIQAFIDKEK